MTGKTSSYALITLIIYGLLSWAVYGVINDLSGKFGLDIPSVQRPLRGVLSLLAANFLIYLLSLWTARKCDSPWLTATIVVFALAFRLVIVTSQPIQEIDIYRYVWDGVATLNGVSPYAFTPQEVLTADPARTLSPQLDKLVQARVASPAVHSLLERVHFGQLLTVYPPTSQAVFAIAAWSTPRQANLPTRLTVMKVWLLLFDVGTIWVVAAMLRHAGVHTAWLLAYAWCPLVVKEFANSGHLDSIAVFLCAFAMYLSARAFFPKTRDSRFATVLAANFLLALAIAAKLYPVVLVPLISLTTCYRFGLGKAIAAIILCGILTTAFMLPMLLDTGTTTTQMVVDSADPFTSVQSEDVETGGELSGDSRTGLRAFLSSWIMNDFIFLNVMENLTPDAQRTPDRLPWFVVVPNGWREAWTHTAARLFPIEQAQAPFFLARSITAAIFFALAIYWAWQAARAVEATLWSEYVFLTLAWFWLLLPTLNPWYWIWALPWIPFARNRTWFLLSGLVLIYYLRFYFAAHYTDRPVISFLPYRGEPFFDFVVVWFEYLPWFVCLAVTFILRVRKDRIRQA